MKVAHIASDDHIVSRSRIHSLFALLEIGGWKRLLFHTLIIRRFIHVIVIVLIILIAVILPGTSYYSRCR